MLALEAKLRDAGDDREAYAKTKAESPLSPAEHDIWYSLNASEDVWRTGRYNETQNNAVVGTAKQCIRMQ